MYLKLQFQRNMQSQSENNLDISFEMGAMNSMPSTESHNNEPQTRHRTQKITSKSNSSRFIKFQKRNSCKKVSFSSI